MDRWSGKKAIDARRDSKKGLGVVLRDSFSSDDKRCTKVTRFIGSSSRFSPNGKEVIGTSSEICGSSSSSVESEKQPLSQTAIDLSERIKVIEAEIESEILEIYRRMDNRRPHNKLNYRIDKTHKAEPSNLHPGPSGDSPSANQECRPLLSGVIPSGFELERRLRKRKVYGESSSRSSAKGKNITEPSAEENRRGFNSRGSVFDSRRARHSILNNDNDLVSVGSRVPVNRSSSSISLSLNSPVSLELFSGIPESGLSGSLSSQDRSSRNDLDRISEELHIMERGLLQRELSFYDQHRDMRLDIDNMSYEELLALGERIGTVSTGLTEEAISKCLKTSTYKMKPSSYGSITKTPCDQTEDTTCSICQEEYAIRDEVGRLHCEHSFHLKCVQEWLQMKNWCPICKASAEASPS